jgi:uncharacterized membrane protein
MRTLIAVIIGLVLSFGFVFASHFLGRSKLVGAFLFVGLWLVFCVVDYLNGVKAGYSAMDELGIHALIFIVPALSAWLAARFVF